MSISLPPVLLAVVSLLLSVSVVHAAVVSVTLNASFAPFTQGSGVNRNGGNQMTNWNWQLDASNSGNDWSVDGLTTAAQPAR
jgi:hypothetical protein